MHIRHTTDYSTAFTIATTLVHSRLEYCNSLYHALPAIQIKRLQQIQNALARTDPRTPKHLRITPALKSLHWLKIEQRIQFKIVSITDNLLHKSLSSYLRKLIYIKPTGKTGSSDHLCLSLPPLTFKLTQNHRSLFPKRFSASLELSFHHYQVFLLTNSNTILSNTSSIQHTVFFTQSVPLPPQNTHILSFIPLKFTTFHTYLRLSTGQLRTARNTSEHPRIYQHH